MYINIQSIDVQFSCYLYHRQNFDTLKVKSKGTAKKIIIKNKSVCVVRYLLDQRETERMTADRLG